MRKEAPVGLGIVGTLALGVACIAVGRMSAEVEPMSQVDVVSCNSDTQQDHRSLMLNGDPKNSRTMSVEFGGRPVTGVTIVFNQVEGKSTLNCASISPSASHTTSSLMLASERK